MQFWLLVIQQKMYLQKDQGNVFSAPNWNNIALNNVQVAQSLLLGRNLPIQTDAILLLDIWDAD